MQTRADTYTHIPVGQKIYLEGMRTGIWHMCNLQHVINYWCTSHMVSCQNLYWDGCCIYLLSARQTSYATPPRVTSQQNSKGGQHMNALSSASAPNKASTQEAGFKKRRRPRKVKMIDPGRCSTTGLVITTY
eukprot:scaffold81676_cov17-Tisochrysis_lutea.AAC.1